jgi:SAM-dependent methyltransferase
MQRMTKTQQQYKSLIELLAKRQKNGKSAKLLEIGPGEMTLTRFLPNSIEYHSLDIGDKKSYSAGKGKKQTYLFNLDDGKFPIKDGTYEYVVCFETLEHVMYPERVLKEISRVAKNNAIFFLSLPNEYNFAQRIYFLLGIKTYCDEPFQVVEKHLHIHKPRVKDIINLFGSQFRIRKIEYIWQSTKLPGFADKIINLCAQIMPSLFSRMVVITATKKN